MLALAAPLTAADPPPDLARRVAARESEQEAARSQYLYEQAVIVEEMSERNATTGRYEERREVIFSPAGERTEKLVGKPQSRLVRLILTEEDFRDIREVQPLLLTKDRLFLYETRYRGEETVDGHDCWLLQVRPRQILDGQRLFDGLLWISQKDYAIVRTEGRAVPEIRTTRHENLFPRFVTLRAPVDNWWFPVETIADDTLDFRTGPLRVRMSIRYRNYRRFGSESSVTFGETEAERKPQ